MNREYVLKHIKLVLWGVAVAFMAQIFFTAQVYANDLEENAPAVDVREEQVLLLSKTLTEVGKAVADSTEITAKERVALFTQLIELSRIIVALQRSIALEEATERERARLPVDSIIVTLAEINLDKVTVQLNMDTFEADITEHYLDEDDDLEGDPFGVVYDKEERTVALEQPRERISFADKVRFAKNQVVDLIVAETGVSNSLEVSRATAVSARNPDRNKLGIRQNSPLAYELLQDFGARSLITDVEVLVGEGYAKIILFSDQDERMELELIRNDYEYEDFAPDREGGSFTERPSGDEYQVVTSYFASTFGDPVVTSGGRADAYRELPKVREAVAEIKENDVIETLNELFDEIPFTGVLSRADEKLLNFLTQNGIYWVGSSDKLPSTPRECVDRADALVVNEYMLQLLSGLDTNYILDELDIRYPVRMEFRDRISPADVGCQSVTKYF